MGSFDPDVQFLFTTFVNTKCHLSSALFVLLCAFVVFAGRRGISGLVFMAVLIAAAVLEEHVCVQQDQYHVAVVKTGLAEDQTLLTGEGSMGSSAARQL